MKIFKVQSPSSSAKATEDGQSKVRRDHDREGVALVITLIMLSIITFMAVTFLVLSQRERSSVNGATDQKIARNASDAALARVSTELLARMMLQTNFQDFDLMVSTNYINNNGFIDGLPPDPRNVNYDHETNQINFTGGPVEWERNIANLLYNPRPPVFVETNAGIHASEFRFYRDENRNGRFDTNGLRPVINSDVTHPYFNASNGLPELPNFTGPILSNTFVGDPEWIGVLERPEELHSADNRFIARYAYLVVPVGKTLDINTMHNQAVSQALNVLNDGYMRNQGVGPWELNLAAFLTDLNTNAWYGPLMPGYNPPSPYDYERPFGLRNTGVSFEDALLILSNRYAGNFSSLASASQEFPGGAAALALDNIDEYSDGGLMTNTANINESLVKDPILRPWSGSDNINHFFSSQDIFSLLPASVGARLSQLGSSNDSYNAYTFYRMLAQLGTDSPTDRKKININYKNMDDNGNVIPGMETNLNSWPAMDFFTNAAAAMFQQMDMHDFNGNLVTVTNIPIYEDFALSGGITNQNYYTPAVHRVLQLAANIFDATQTNRIIGSGPTNYPTVFRPVFQSKNGVVYIVGFQEVADTLAATSFQFLEPKNFAKINQGPRGDINLYGVPWVIGAKKGFPNFNEFSMINPLTISRKLEFTNTLGQVGRPNLTNQIYDFAVTNVFGLEAWNSYTNAYGNTMRMIVSNELSISLTNETGFSLITVSNLAYGNDITFSGWPGWSQNDQDTRSFKVPLSVSQLFTNGNYTKTGIFPLNPVVWGAIYVPHLFMVLENKIRYVLIDQTANRVIDFVNIDKIEPPIDIDAQLYTGQFNGSGDINHNEAQWNTNLTHGLPIGVLNQILASLSPSSQVWQQVQPSPTIRASQASTFNGRLAANGSDAQIHFQAPITDSAIVVQRLSWQANDPLVHYLVSDIVSTNGSRSFPENQTTVVWPSGTVPTLDNLSALNFAYQPWGGMHYLPGSSDENPNQFSTDARVKDPGLLQSDNWDFPTNKLPGIGWLGRIHRGTAWQTVDMKPSNISPADWTTWANDNVILTNANNNFIVDAQKSHPSSDYGLFDLFTTAVNENASYGRLNVNQTNLAAWSAVLSGVNVLTNSATRVVFPTGVFPMLISPAGVYDASNPTPVAAIVNGINATRANTNSQNGSVQVFKDGFFQHAGDVLATPQLSIASPFINTNSLQSRTGDGLTDEVVERIPQQIMSLLTLNETPRFVIYSYGQTLHPADHSLVTGGTFNGLCTNYQITAESATRAVVRVEGTADPNFTGGKVDSQGRSYPPHIVVEQFNVLGPD